MKIPFVIQIYLVSNLDGSQGLLFDEFIIGGFGLPRNGACGAVVPARLGGYVEVLVAPTLRSSEAVTNRNADLDECPRNASSQTLV